MDPSNLENVGKQVSQQLFTAKSVVIDDNSFPIQKTSSSRLRNVTIEGIMFMEQNQRKKSKWAQLAKEGHEIIWIFKNNTYIGRIVDGDVTIF